MAKEWLEIIISQIARRQKQVYEWRIKKSHYFSSVWNRIFFSFCMMLLVSLPEMEREGEGLRTSSVCPMFRTDASDPGVSDTGVSWKKDISNGETKD